MKRNLFALLMCLVMACCGIACGEDAAPDLTGVWALDAIVMGEERISPSMMGLEMTLTVNGDGTLVAATNGEEEPGTWTQAGSELHVAVEVYTHKDGMLIIEKPAMGAILYFVRASEEETAAPAPVAAADIAEFNGAWELTTVNMMGMDMSAAMMGMGVSFEIQDGAVLAAVSEILEDGTENIMPFEGKGNLVEGALALEMPEGMEDFNSILQLRSDDKAFSFMAADGMELILIFERIVAE